MHLTNSGRMRLRAVQLPYLLHEAPMHRQSSMPPSVVPVCRRSFSDSAWSSIQKCCVGQSSTVTPRQPYSNPTPTPRQSRSNPTAILRQSSGDPPAILHQPPGNATAILRHSRGNPTAIPPQSYGNPTATPQRLHFRCRGTSVSVPFPFRVLCQAAIPRGPCIPQIIWFLFWISIFGISTIPEPSHSESQNEAKAEHARGDCEMRRGLFVGVQGSYHFNRSDAAKSRGGQ